VGGRVGWLGWYFMRNQGQGGAGCQGADIRGCSICGELEYTSRLELDVQSSKKC
jgi:hypothetical protein